MNEDVVSIIVPVYNAEKTVKKCIDSIRVQTYRHLEIIVVNDGSTDKSEAILSDLSQQDERITVISIPNEGVSNARNKGLERATGKYVEFVDSDDYIAENMVELLVNLIKEKNVDFVANGYVVHSGENVRNIVYQEKLFCSSDEIIQSVPELYEEGILNTIWNKLYVRDKIVSNFNKTVIVGEDLIFNIDYMEQITSMFIDDSCTYQYNAVVSQNNLSAKYHEDAIVYLNAQFTKILDVSKAKCRTEIADFSDLYTREFIRILRKATEVNANRTEKVKMIEKAAEFYDKNLLHNALRSNNKLFVVKKALEKKRIRTLIIIGYFVETVYRLKSNLLTINEQI